MLESQQQPPAGNYGWLAAVVAGAVAGVQAWYHKRTRPKRLVPMKNAEEMFERLEYLESMQQGTGKSDSRIWGEITDMKASMNDMRERMVDREDLDAFERRIRRLLENRT